MSVRSIKVTINGGGGVRNARQPYENPPHVIASGACPQCKAEPFKVRGFGQIEEGHDWQKAGALCVDCGYLIGRIKVSFDTIFGLEEDRRVLVHGRPRVYG